MGIDTTIVQDFLLRQSCKVTNRYRTTILATKKADLGIKVLDAVKAKFPSYAIWDGFDSTSEHLNLNANELLSRIKAVEEPGIIFYMPEEWQIMWGIRSKRMFLSALSMLFGNVPHVILICKAGDEFVLTNKYYFKLIKSIDNDVDIFVPQRVDGKYGAV